MNHTISCKHFNDLTTLELYAIIRLRNEVFVVEQNCVFQDADNKDLGCYHLMMCHENKLIAYARLVPPGISYHEMSIGRVVSNRQYRREGFGTLLMESAIENCYKLFGRDTIKIGAQLYLKKFYESFGFIQLGEEYDEDGIPHIEMIL